MAICSMGIRYYRPIPDSCTAGKVLYSRYRLLHKVGKSWKSLMVHILGEWRDGHLRDFLKFPRRLPCHYHLRPRHLLSPFLPHQLHLHPHLLLPPHLPRHNFQLPHQEIRLMFPSLMTRSSPPRALDLNERPRRSPLPRGLTIIHSSFL